MEDSSEACIKNSALNVVGWNKEILKKTSLNGKGTAPLAVRCRNAASHCCTSNKPFPILFPRNVPVFVLLSLCQGYLLFWATAHKPKQPLCLLLSQPFSSAVGRAPCLEEHKALCAREITLELMFLREGLALSPAAVSSPWTLLQH